MSTIAGRYIVTIEIILKDNTCWFLAVDFDKKDWQEDAKAFMDTWGILCSGIYGKVPVRKRLSCLDLFSGTYFSKNCT